MAHHPRAMSTPRACLSLLSRLRKGSVSSLGGEEQDSGFCTPGSGFESFVSPESSWSTRREYRSDSRVNDSIGESHLGNSNVSLDTTDTKSLNCRSESRSNFRPDEKVDFFSLLDGRNSRNGKVYAPVLSKIFSFLSDEDIAASSRVCKSWNRVINGDMLVRARVKNYLNRKISNVENECEMDRKSNLLLDQRSTTPDQSSKSFRLLKNVTNLPPSHSKVSSSLAPQQTPVNTKYNLYRQEGEKLSAEEFLTPCPRCEDPARVNKTSKLALCVNQACVYAFCTSCFCPYSLGSPHSCPQAPPTPRSRKKYCSISTKRSKANLKRLL